MHAAAHGITRPYASSEENQRVAVFRPARQDFPDDHGVITRRMGGVDPTVEPRERIFQDGTPGRLGAAPDPGEALVANTPGETVGELLFGVPEDADGEVPGREDRVV